MFQVGLPCSLELNSCRSVSINALSQTSTKRGSIFPETFMVRACCPNVKKLGNIVSSDSFCFQDVNYACATRQRILTKIRACEQLQKFCEHEQASTHPIFARNPSKGQILRALSNWIGQFDTLYGSSAFRVT